jgi:hypothetical protein
VLLEQLSDKSYHNYTQNYLLVFQHFQHFVTICYHFQQFYMFRCQSMFYKIIFLASIIVTNITVKYFVFFLLDFVTIYYHLLSLEKKNLILFSKNIFLFYFYGNKLFHKKTDFRAFQSQVTFCNFFWKLI